MSAGGRNRQCSLRVHLSANITQVEYVVRFHRRVWHATVLANALQQTLSLDVRADLEQVIGAPDKDSRGFSHFVDIRTRNDDLMANLRGACCREQQAPGRLQLAAERKLAVELAIRKIRRALARGNLDLARCDENPECDGKVEPPAFLGQVGGREIHCDPIGGEVEF